MTVDHFANKAGDYEQNKNRVDNVANIAQGILDTVPFNRAMHVIDFGSGTGLLLEKIAPHVGKITAVDVSPAMNQQLQKKLNQMACPVEMLEVDLTTADIPFQVDGIISSMTMHHVENIAAMFNKFYAMLKPGGFIALADLDAEDGSFHTEDTGVFHHGFDRATFTQAATNAGFQSAKTTSASEIQKPNRAYGVFLLTAFKSA